MTKEEFISYTQALPEPPAHQGGTWSGWSAPWSVGDQLQVENTFSTRQHPYVVSSLVINEMQLRQFLDQSLDAAVTASYHVTIARATLTAAPLGRPHPRSSFCSATAAVRTRVV
jgi:hypothetical protein